MDQEQEAGPARRFASHPAPAAAPRPLSLLALAEAVPAADAAASPQAVKQTSPPTAAPAEQGGPKGPEPTRYGDWERSGRCVDF